MYDLRTPFVPHINWIRNALDMNDVCRYCILMVVVLLLLTQGMSLLKFKFIRAGLNKYE